MVSKTEEDGQKITDNNNVKIYKETTRPLKKKRRDKSDLGENFVPPDGGWGWVVCIAAGLSNMVQFPALQQYGLVYRLRLQQLRFSSSEISTIINTVMGVSSIMGLTNGAMFRRFTFRQVALVGSILATSGIVASAFCRTFLQYIVFFSFVFGLGLGFCMSATSLAVNTYFKAKRRRATGFSWTITGLGPIIYPHLVTLSLVNFGVQGTVLLIAAISMNATAAALVLQPVLWHVKTPAKNAAELEAMSPEPEYKCKFCQTKNRKRSVLDNSYTFNDDDKEKPGFEAIGSMTPMMSRANDGWYGSKTSLATDAKQQNETKRLSVNSLSVPNYFHREKEEQDRYSSMLSIKVEKGEFKCTCAEERALLQKRIDTEALKTENANITSPTSDTKPVTFLHKLVIFFDLDLLKDFTFVNLVLGVTIIIFGEMNFSVLTPFILNEFGFSDTQISTAMSMTAGLDIVVRFVAPLVLEKVKLGNRLLFGMGIVCIAIGRLCVAYTRRFETLLSALVLVGIGKGFRTIFAPLILPSYVPLNRLAAASGIQLMSNGIFTFAFGPIIGMVTDATSYSTTIHFINFLTCLALFSWTAETAVRKILYKRKEQRVQEN